MEGTVPRNGRLPSEVADGSRRLEIASTLASAPEHLSQWWDWQRQKWGREIYGRRRADQNFPAPSRKPAR